MDGKDKTKGVEHHENKRIRISITSRKVKDIERTANELVKKAREFKVEHGNIEVKGPVRMPTKILKMTVRKSPCGEGSKTWDRYELRVTYKNNKCLDPQESHRFGVHSPTIDPYYQYENRTRRRGRVDFQGRIRRYQLMERNKITST